MAALPNSVAEAPGLQPWRIALIAFACNPDAGSEGGVGWNWAATLARLGHAVTVLTLPRYRDAIHAAVAADPSLRAISFVYIGSNHLDLLTRPSRPTFQIFYIGWQIWARRWLKRYTGPPFHVAHAITIGGLRFPSFLGGVARCAVIGPLGGGEQFPAALRRGLDRRSAAKEAMRDALISLGRFDPLLAISCGMADVVLVKTRESAAALPPMFFHKAVEAQEIGADPDSLMATPRSAAKLAERRWQILYVGRFLGWKGMDYGIRAFARLATVAGDARLTLVGRGPQQRHWQALAKQLGIADNIRWMDWLPKRELTAVYRQHDLFLFPSLRDSSGNVVLEALAQGLPVVCLALGGPRQMVGARCGAAVDPSGLAPHEVIASLADRMLALLESPEHYERTSQGALAVAAQATWKARVETVYRDLIPRLATLPQRAALDATGQGCEQPVTTGVPKTRER